MEPSRCLAGWFSVGVVLLAVTSVSGQWQRRPPLYENSQCEASNRLPGTCRLLAQCPSQQNLIAGNRRFQPVICGFRRNSPIVCCPHEQGPQTAAPVWRLKPTIRPPTTPGPVPTSGVSFGRLLQPTTVAQTGGGGPTTAGEKSAKACRNYSKQVSKFQLVPLIFNGKGTIPGEFPHMALLGYRPPPQTQLTWNCGGALISDRFVVTAAHCFTNNMLRAPVMVRLGEFDLSDDEDGAVDYGIKRWVRHPKFEKQSWYHDLALIELNRLVTFTRFIQPACIWNQPEDPDTGLIVTGWGSTQEDGLGPMSQILLEGNGTLNKVSPDICTEFFKAATLQLRAGAQPGILCAMDPTGRTDTCPGDSGGPIQVPAGGLTSISYYVVGVVSGGSKWCGDRVPAIYTSLHTYIDWIESQVWGQE